MRELLEKGTKIRIVFCMAKSYLPMKISNAWNTWSDQRAESNSCDRRSINDKISKLVASANARRSRTLNLKPQSMKRHKSEMRVEHTSWTISCLPKPIWWKWAVNLLEWAKHRIQPGSVLRSARLSERKDMVDSLNQQESKRIEHAKENKTSGLQACCSETDQLARKDWK